MVKADGEYKEALSRKSVDGEMKRDYRVAGSLAVMGISNLHSGAALALSGTDAASAAAVMRWDLVNPWARLYELNSTHPLTALRVRELNRQSENANQAAMYPLPTDERVKWGGFPIEVLVWGVPIACIVAFWIVAFVPEWFSYFGIALPEATKPVLLIAGGIGWLLRVAYRYRGRFEDATVASLLQDTEVSQMRPRAVRLRGEIVGRGVPGAFYSPDLVLRDASGIIFLLYRQTIPLARFFFAISEADDYIGETVEVEGWFRRGLRPYVEMSQVKGEHVAMRHTYSRWVQCALALAAIVVGWYWLHA
jgi:hypothetical protein